MIDPGSTPMSGPLIQRYYAESPKIREAEVLPIQIIVLDNRRNINDVVHIPGGQRIITGSNDGLIRVWDLESGAEIGDRWQVEGYPVSVTSMVLSPNGNTLASGYQDGMVRLWDIGTGKVIVEWTGHTDQVKSMCWSPDGERVVSGSNDGTARVWYCQSGEPVVGLNPMINSGYNIVWTVAYSPDGTKIAVGGQEKNALKIWDARTGELLSTVEFQEEGRLIILSDDSSERSESGCIGQPVLSLVWASDGKKLISGFQCGWIRIFDTATWQETAVINLHRAHVDQVVLFRNDRLLASATWKEVRLWNLDTNLPVGPRLVHDYVPDCLSFTDDGKLVVGAGAYVSIWDTHAIVKEAGLEDLMTIPDVCITSSKSFLLRTLTILISLVQVVFRRGRHGISS
ncbi:WD40 repeat-like protein [Suillus decipiens]|nr:WD40 repeat-like protein [Suillus decipiens]